MEHLAPYLQYGVKVQIEFDSTNVVEEVLSIYPKDGYIGIDNECAVLLTDCKLLLRPLSDYKDVNSKAMSDLNCDISTQIMIADFAIKAIGLHHLPYIAVCVLFQNHLDVFGLIDKGFAVDMNTIEG